MTVEELREGGLTGDDITRLIDTINFYKKMLRTQDLRLNELMQLAFETGLVCGMCMGKHQQPPNEHLLDNLTIH